jgi:hypothetical protein
MEVAGAIVFGKILYHLERAAIGGHPLARHSLVVKRLKMVSFIAASLGYQLSIERIFQQAKKTSPRGSLCTPGLRRVRKGMQQRFGGSSSRSSLKLKGKSPLPVADKK